MQRRRRTGRNVFAYLSASRLFSFACSALPSWTPRALAAALWPSRALLLIAALWLLLIPIYAWPICQMKRPPTEGSVYRIWPKDRIEVHEHKPKLDNPTRIERLHGRGLAAIGW